MSATMSQTMLQLDQVSAGYGNILALKDVTLSVEQGEIVTVVGANGAGKTTTLKTIAGLMRARSGSITFEGQPIDHLPAEKVATLGIAMVPEGRRLFPDMTVYENLLIGAFNQKDKAKVQESLDRCYRLFPILAERKGQLAATLSGGEQQMAAIARALMAQPRLLLLDEPSLGLAPILVKTVFKLIEEINHQGVTVLLVEQNSNMALKIAHRGYVLENGVTVMSDTAEALLRSDVVRASYLGE
jgi:branched-chain amino acid transport system ATP-binding protein